VTLAVRPRPGGPRPGDLARIARAEGAVLLPFDKGADGPGAPGDLTRGAVRKTARALARAFLAAEGGPAATAGGVIGLGAADDDAAVWPEPDEDLAPGLRETLFEAGEEEYVAVDEDGIFAGRAPGPTGLAGWRARRIGRPPGAVLGEWDEDW
jgi:hypothetical protein